ncbi:hypothetical protein HSX11_16350 [Oxalobacteraceae bacterium]|nr:hypothetical protein [Oxalobacteraceae bacterium]
MGSWKIGIVYFYSSKQLIQAHQTGSSLPPAEAFAVQPMKAKSIPKNIATQQESHIARNASSFYVVLQQHPVSVQTQFRIVVFL